MKSTLLVDILAPDPFDVGALLSAALDACGLTQADVARATGMAASNLSRAFNSPDTRPVVARRILTALGRRAWHMPDGRGPQ